MKLISPPFRATFVSLAKPRGFKDSAQPPKYQMSLMVPKNHPWIKDVETKIAEICQEKFGKKAIKFKYPPFKEADEKYGLEDYFLLNLKSAERPTVVDINRVEIDPDGCYSGAIYRASFNIYTYDHPVGGKGIGFGLNNVQFVKDGERLGPGKSDPNEDFSEMANV